MTKQEINAAWKTVAIVVTGILLLAMGYFYPIGLAILYLGIIASAIVGFIVFLIWGLYKTLLAYENRKKL